MTKTAAPIHVRKEVNVIPIMKLHTHEDKLPIAIADDLSAVSNSSTPMKNGTGPKPI